MILRRAFALSAIAACSAGAWAFSPLASYTIYGTDPNGVWTPILEAGTVYEFKAWGKIVWGNNIDAQDDPAYYRVDWPGHTPTYSPSISLSAGSFFDHLGLQDDGSWARAFSPSHTYKLYYVGQGQSIRTWFGDTYYGDNSGSYQVEISAVPEPCSAGIFAFGLASVFATRMKRRRDRTV